MRKKEENKHIPYPIPPLDLFAVPRGGIVTDPFGSYTGLVYDLDDKPVQDADDL